MSRSPRKTRAERCASTGHRWTRTPRPGQEGWVDKSCQRCGASQVAIRILPHVEWSTQSIEKLRAAIEAHDSDPDNMQRRPR